MPSPSLSLDSVRLDVAAVLGEEPADVSVDENLQDLGLDSIRVMTLVERWRAAGNRVEFAELIEATPTIRGWHAHLTAA
ncbi:phosphopantetheine-binding protein [Streptomyces roseoverticillatus]|uniref:phosphopantetheine-binding protein n=1 Tax=Streptomyces roseoverticillatus TaxID=66429 RepID=UPI0004C04E5D|nr:phosphopantetheine-binding protein [Streptomyces roseoverticillatus]